MGTITSGIGLVSGINTSQIIDQLMAIESRSKNALTKRIESTNSQKLAYASLQTQLTSLKLSGTSLKKVTAFQQATANSSNENVLTATASVGAAPGSYQFQVARMVSSQQVISQGYASESSLIGAGTITVEMGGGEVDSQTLLTQLNGGAGVRRGIFRIVDRSGKSAVIDTSTALTLDDVIQKINTNLDITVSAKVDGDRITLLDQTGQVTNELAVIDMGGGHAAADLGIAGTGAGTSAITGSVINYIGRSTTLTSLNDGRGVRLANGVPDFQLAAANGSTYDITLGTATTVGGVLDAINTATGGAITASLTPGGKSITLVDNSGGGALTVTSLNGSAAHDLGLEQTVQGNQISGSDIMASMNTVMLASLRGGKGLSLGTIQITDRNGGSASVDMTGARTVQEILDRINNNGAAAVTASLKESGNGIQITDNSGGVGELVIADADSTTAAELGIVGNFNLATQTVRGANLQRQWISENTLLSSYNGGKGVSGGIIRITNATGASAVVDLSKIEGATLGEVINKINQITTGGLSPVNVIASINDTGDGLLLTDNSGGTSKLRVDDVSGTAAASLRIKGTATTTVLDGTFEQQITVGATDKLSDVMAAINAPGFGVAATTINDSSGSAGSSGTRLSLTARNSGRAGRVIVDGGTTSLQTSTLLDAQDAVVFYGSSDPSHSLLLTSNSNKISGIIKGVSIDLHGVSSSPVTVNVATNIDNVVADLQKFADNFNSMVDKIKEYTKYDSTTNAKGILLGDGTVQQVEREIYNIMQASVLGVGPYRMLGDIGLKTVSGAKLELDEEKLRTAYANNAEAVKALFTSVQTGSGTTATGVKGIGYIIEDSVAKLTDPEKGLLTRQNNSLDQRTTEFQDRIKQMDKLLEAKRLRLQKQFASMETVLAKLQSQQSALNSLSTSTSSSSSTSN